MRWIRPTVRARLTLVYGGLFLTGGIVLLALTYVLVQGSLRHSVAPRTGGISRQAGRSGATKGVNAPPMITPEEAQRQLRLAEAAYRNRTLDSLLTQGGIALGAVTVAALGLGWVLADRALRPMHRITDTARRVARGNDLSARIAYSGPRDDVRELADTFDTMLGRLARAFDGQQRFVANASHELRTPLAINRTLVDVALRRPDASADARRLGESLLVVNSRHERLIDGLLTLAGSENRIADLTPVDLAEVARHVLQQSKTEAETHGITCADCELSPAPTTGDPVLIERLVQNLVENAIRHNQDGGEFAVTTRGRGERAELVVTNTGPIVPPYEIDTIFEPFRRLGTDRVRSDRGSGLGLSIVRATATAHGGTANAEPRPGGGLIVTVRLPSA